MTLKHNRAVFHFAKNRRFRCGTLPRNGRVATETVEKPNVRVVWVLIVRLRFDHCTYLLQTAQRLMSASGSFMSNSLSVDADDIVGTLADLSSGSRSEELIGVSVALSDCIDVNA